jgi:hypothetical protein
MRSKLLTACTLIAGAVGLLTAGVALATSAQGLTTTILAGPVTLDEVHFKSKSDGHSVEIKTKGVSDVWVVQNRIVPGGHSHPGPSIISVVSGQATEYHGEDPDNGIVHLAGTAFVDDGEGAHIIRNEGTVDLVLIAFQVLPKDAPRRIDENQP